MLELLFFVLMFMVFGKLFVFAMKASWGLMRILLTIVFLPISLILMVLGGLLSIALPVLVIIGLFTVFGYRR